MPMRPRLNAAPVAEYPRAVHRFLETREYPPDDGRDWFAVFMLDSPHDRSRLVEAWQALGRGITARWVRQSPGSRPWAWWEFDAPRWRREDLPARVSWLSDNQLLELAEPRRRLGGTGTPCFEVLNYWPEFFCGVPTSWVSPFDEAYYNGRARDIHGNRIGTEYAEGHFAGHAVDPESPPLYEAEATYLKRHHLLTPAELRVLTPEDFEPEELNETEYAEPD